MADGYRARPPHSGALPDRSAVLQGPPERAQVIAHVRLGDRRLDRHVEAVVRARIDMQLGRHARAQQSPRIFQVFVQEKIETRTSGAPAGPVMWRSITSMSG